MLRKDLALVKGRDVYNKLNEALLHSQPLYAQTPPGDIIKHLIDPQNVV
jgi:hypothetical protein